ncbi:MAG: TetR family transcriptional regulator [Pseudomonadota bacterium]
MAKVTKEEAMLTRHRLLDSAETVFHSKGFSRTTLEDIAQEAGFTRGAVYWHFKNKSDVFHAMCERARLPMEEIAEAVTDSALNDPLEHLRLLCISFLKKSVEDKHCQKVFDILFHKCEFVDPADPVYKRQQEAFKRAEKLVENLLKRAVLKKLLPINLDTRMATIIFRATIEGILRSWLFLPQHYNLKNQAENLVDACIDTLRFGKTLQKK